MMVRTLAVGASILASGVAASAQDAGDAFTRRFVGMAPGATKGNACFVRIYDAAHLAQHPKQRVSAMMLLVSAEKLPENQSLNFAFQLGVRFRDRNGRFDTGGDCGHAQVTESGASAAHVSCAVDCDGGGLTLDLAEDSKTALVSIDEISINPPGKSEPEDRTSLRAGADDRSFRVTRVALQQCLPLDPERLKTSKRK